MYDNVNRTEQLLLTTREVFLDSTFNSASGFS